VRIFSKNAQLLATSTQLVWFDVKSSAATVPASTT
jgi:hypothetical protein